MKILGAYKTEIDPTNKQRTMFLQCAGTARFVYNYGLAEWKREYESGGKPSAYSLCKQFNGNKDELCPWIREMPYAVTESAFQNLGTAFKNFFRRVKRGDKKVGYPKFKKKSLHDSFQLRSTHIANNQVRLTHIGWVNLKEHGYIPTTESGAEFGVYATISRQADRWFISVLVEEEIPDPQNDSTVSLGIDFGLKSLAVCSDGTVFDNPKALRQEERKLKRLSKELSRRTKGGQNWKKTKAKVGRCHARIANIRKHTLHQISHYVTSRAKTIVLEDLNVSGMMQNHHLAKAIADVGWAELRRQIEYKAVWNGSDVVIADRFYPSSKKCFECGSVKPLLKLSERTFVCEACGAIVDRDLNASKNLEALAAVKHTVDAQGVGVLQCFTENWEPGGPWGIGPGWDTSNGVRLHIEVWLNMGLTPGACGGLVRVEL